MTIPAHLAAAVAELRALGWSVNEPVVVELPPLTGLVWRKDGVDWVAGDFRVASRGVLR